MHYNDESDDTEVEGIDRRRSPRKLKRKSQGAMEKNDLRCDLFSVHVPTTRSRASLPRDPIRARAMYVDA